MVSDHDLLVRIDEKVDYIVSRLDDHEARLRPLESQQYQWLGRDGAIAGGLGLIGGAIIALILWLAGVR
jgi:tetrahydromethanopterin S-methyltransferase subunit G